MSDKNDSRPIPELWKRKVIQVLKSGENITITKRAFDEFQSILPAAFRSELYRVMQRGLSLPAIEGRRVYGMRPEGETYEFIFPYDGQYLYGKICLTDDGGLVVIFSAHRPLKGNTL
jgi:hypothetical protein